MKKKTVLFAVLAVLVIGIGGFFGIRQYVRSLPPRGEPKIYTVAGAEPSFLSSETDFFIASATLVVKGKLTGATDGPRFIESGMPFVPEGLHVTEVYKGDCQPGDDIEFAHVGSEVSLYEMLRDAEEIGIKNAAYNQLGSNYPKGFKSWELKQDVIYRLSAATEKKYALPTDNEEYVFFLHFFQPFQCYAIGVSEPKHYIRKVNERGQVLNPFTENYETIDWETAAKLTKEDVLPGFVSDYEAHPEKFKIPE